MSASSMKTIRNRIRSISSTMKITKAMELMASSKIRAATERIERSRPYFEILSKTLEDIAADNMDFASVFTQERRGIACHIVIAGDRGLAGGYNHNLFKSLDMEDSDIIFPIGKKVTEHFNGKRLYTDAYSVAGDTKISDCREMGKWLSDAYEKGDFARLTLSYTSFKNAIVQIPKTVKLLPLKAKRGEGKNILYEPDSETVFSRIVPYYLSGMIYGALCESVASELSARRNAMESATQNASEMIDNLSLEYNRARQASITQELTEIISGTKNL